MTQKLTLSFRADGDDFHAGMTMSKDTIWKESITLGAIPGPAGILQDTFEEIRYCRVPPHIFWT